MEKLVEIYHYLSLFYHIQLWFDLLVRELPKLYGYLKLTITRKLTIIAMCKYYSFLV